MLTKTNYTVDSHLIQDALDLLNTVDFKTTINKPTGSFFYDPWEIKDEFKNTAWQKILETILTPIGEARIIVLEPGKCYQAHADIDDRYHLNLSGDESYLIDLDCGKMHKLEADRLWYSMNAGQRHTAMNVGYCDRVQLVVRHLLNNPELKNGVPVKIEFKGTNADSARFAFDHEVSPLINRFNKDGVMNSFEYASSFVKFNIAEEFKSVLEKTLSENFRIL